MMDFDWAYLFEISLTGIAGGGLYALAALAFVLVYKATRVVNIAIGEMLMAGGYLFFTFAAMWAMPLWLAIPAAVLASGVLGALGVDPEWASGAVRFSFGPEATPEIALAAAGIVGQCVSRLREFPR